MRNITEDKDVRQLMLFLLGSLGIMWFSYNVYPVLDYGGDFLLAGFLLLFTIMALGTFKGKKFNM